MNRISSRFTRKTSRSHSHNHNSNSSSNSPISFSPSHMNSHMNSPGHNPLLQTGVTFKTKSSIKGNSKSKSKKVQFNNNPNVRSFNVNSPNHVVDKRINPSCFPGMRQFLFMYRMGMSKINNAAYMNVLRAPHKIETEALMETYMNSLKRIFPTPFIGNTVYVLAVLHGGIHYEKNRMKTTTIKENIKIHPVSPTNAGEINFNNPILITKILYNLYYGRKNIDEMIKISKNTLNEHKLCSKKNFRYIHKQEEVKNYIHDYIEWANNDLLSLDTRNDIVIGQHEEMINKTYGYAFDKKHIFDGIYLINNDNICNILPYMDSLTYNYRNKSISTTTEDVISFIMKNNSAVTNIVLFDLTCSNIDTLGVSRGQTSYNEAGIQLTNPEIKELQHFTHDPRTHSIAKEYFDMSKTNKKHNDYYLLFTGHYARKKGFIDEAFINANIKKEERPLVYDYLNKFFTKIWVNYYIWYTPELAVKEMKDKPFHSNQSQLKMKTIQKAKISTTPPIEFNPNNTIYKSSNKDRYKCTDEINETWLMINKYVVKYACDTFKLQKENLIKYPSFYKIINKKGIDTLIDIYDILMDPKNVNKNTVGNIMDDMSIANIMYIFRTRNGPLNRQSLKDRIQEYKKSKDIEDLRIKPTIQKRLLMNTGIYAFNLFFNNNIQSRQFQEYMDKHDPKIKQPLLDLADFFLLDLSLLPEQLNTIDVIFNKMLEFNCVPYNDFDANYDQCKDKRKDLQESKGIERIQKYTEIEDYFYVSDDNSNGQHTLTNENIDIYDNYVDKYNSRFSFNHDKYDISKGKSKGETKSNE